jgi:uncharacterized protein (DUF58 family)
LTGISIDEEALSEFARQIQLIGGHVLDGLQASKRFGLGVEYHSTVPYSSGDDLRRIDWKRLASSDRLYVQKFDKEEKSNWHIICDFSPSMSYESKRDYANRFSASLCFLANAFNDRWQLNEFSGASLRDAFEILLLRNSAVDFKKISTIEFFKNSIVILVSDFFFDIDELKFLENLDASSQVHFVQVLDKKESEFPFEGVIQFRDMESPRKLTLDARVVRGRYLKKMQDLEDDLRRLTMKPRLRSFVAGSNDSIHQDLFNFFEDL